MYDRIFGDYGLNTKKKVTKTLMRYNVNINTYKETKRSKKTKNIMIYRLGKSQNRFNVRNLFLANLSHVSYALSFRMSVYIDG